MESWEEGPNHPSESAPSVLHGRPQRPDMNAGASTLVVALTINGSCVSPPTVQVGEPLGPEHRPTATDLGAYPPQNHQAQRSLLGCKRQGGSLCPIHVTSSWATATLSPPESVHRDGPP